MKVYPDLVTKLTHFCGGWLVGSSADPSNKDPRDYDVFVPVKFWQLASSSIDTTRDTLKCVHVNNEHIVAKRQTTP